MEKKRRRKSPLPAEVPASVAPPAAPEPPVEPEPPLAPEPPAGARAEAPGRRVRLAERLAAVRGWLVEKVPTAHIYLFAAKLWNAGPAAVTRYLERVKADFAKEASEEDYLAHCWLAKLQQEALVDQTMRKLPAAETVAEVCRLLDLAHRTLKARDQLMEKMQEHRVKTGRIASPDAGKGERVNVFTDAELDDLIRRLRELFWIQMNQRRRDHEWEEQRKAEAAALQARAAGGCWVEPRRERPEASRERERPEEPRDRPPETQRRRLKPYDGLFPSDAPFWPPPERAGIDEGWAAWRQDLNDPRFLRPRPPKPQKQRNPKPRQRIELPPEGEAMTPEEVVERLRRLASGEVRS